MVDCEILNGIGTQQSVLTDPEGERDAMSNPDPNRRRTPLNSVPQTSDFLDSRASGGSLAAVLLDHGAYTQKIRRRTLVAQKGTPQEGLMAVVSGLVKLSMSWHDGRTQILGLRFPGEFVTLRSQAEPWFADVEVVEDATLLILETAKADQLRQENTRFNTQLNAHVNREIAATQAHLLTLGRRAPLERLASLLVEFKDRGAGLKTARGEVRLPMSRDEIGDYIGLESETVSRQFTRLKADGYIHLVSPSRVQVQDWAALIQLSNGERSLAAE